MKKYILNCVLFISCFSMLVGCSNSFTKKNEIVLIINKDFKNYTAIKSVQDLTKIKLDKLSIGTPEIVPQG